MYKSHDSQRGQTQKCIYLVICVQAEFIDLYIYDFCLLLFPFGM